MRAELQELDLIDRLLDGTLQEEEQAEVTSKMLSDAEFQASVALQQHIQEAVSRKALMAEIAAAHQRHLSTPQPPSPTTGSEALATSGAWYSGKTVLWIALAVLGTALCGWLIYRSVGPSDSQANQPVEPQNGSAETLLPPAQNDVDWPEITRLPKKEIQPQDRAQNRLQAEANTHLINPKKDEQVIDPRSGAVLRFPANILVDAAGNAVEGMVRVSYQEFRDPADIAASNIPMLFKEQSGAQRFNSAGMFEIQAVDEQGKAVFVKPEKQIELFFPMTEDLPQTAFYHLDAESRQWTFLHDISEEQRPSSEALAALYGSQPSGSPLPNIGLDSSAQTSADAPSKEQREAMVDQPLPFCFAARFMSDTLRSVKWVIDYGLQEAQKEDPTAMFQFEPPKRLTRFNDRFESMDFLGTKLREEAPQKAPFIRLKALDEVNDEGVFKLTADLKTFPELKKVVLVNWEIMDKKVAENTKQLSTIQFVDIRVKRVEKKERSWFSFFTKPEADLIFLLKDSDAFYEIPVRMHRSNFSVRAASKKRKTDLCNELMTEYQTALVKRQKRFDKPLKEEENFLLARHNEALNRFYDVSGLFMDLGEFQLKEERWFEMFVALPQVMETRYDSLKLVYQMQGQQITWVRAEFDRIEEMFTVNNEPFPNRSDRSIRHASALEAVSLPDEPPTNFYGSEEERDQRAAEAAQQRIVKTPAKPQIVPANTPAKLVRRLRLPGFGAYNCDQLYRVPKSVNILAHYKDEHGRSIEDPKLLTNIDLNFNGSFNFDPVFFSTSKVGRNYFLLYTSSGAVYFMDEDAFDAMEVKRSGKYTFRMRNVSAELTTVSDLRRLLRLGGKPSTDAQVSGNLP